MPEFTGAEEALDSAYNWYTLCQSVHHRCRLPAGSRKGWLPTRMIDIGPNNDSLWRLIETRNQSSSATESTYMTLSYRWGYKPQRLILLTSNMSDFVQGLPSQGLPQTFKDFALLARRFRVRYIWIDAFCIIQDSDEDWSREALLMRYVYANSTCNVAATASEDPDGGLFRHRDRRSLRIGVVEAPFMATRAGTHWIFDRTFWDRKILCGPLHKRGWVFQERLLAARVLYFTHDQIMWECLTDAKCEVFPKGVPYHLPLKHMNILWELVELQRAPNATSCGAVFARRELINIWNDIV